MQYQFDVISGTVVANSSEDQKTAFYRNTYLHVAGFIVAFVLMTAGMIATGVDLMMMDLYSINKFIPLGIMFAFMFGVGMIEGVVARTEDKTTKYLVSLLCVFVYALVSVVLISFVIRYTTNVLPTAMLVTGAIAVGVTAVAFTTRKDFSFIRQGLTMVMVAMVVMISASVLFGFELGSWFSVLGILYAAGCMLYTTSNMIHHYSPDQYIEASLHLFGSLWMIFMYVLRFLLAFMSDE